MSNSDRVTETIEMKTRAEDTIALCAQSSANTVADRTVLIKRWWRLIVIIVTPIVALPMPLIINTIVNNR